MLLERIQWIPKSFILNSLKHHIVQKICLFLLPTTTTTTEVVQILAPYRNITG